MDIMQTQPIVLTSSEIERAVQICQRKLELLYRAHNPNYNTNTNTISTEFSSWSELNRLVNPNSAEDSVSSSGDSFRFISSVSRLVQEFQRELNAIASLVDGIQREMALQGLGPRPPPEPNIIERVAEAREFAALKTLSSEDAIRLAAEVTGLCRGALRDAGLVGPAAKGDRRARRRDALVRELTYGRELLRKVPTAVLPWRPAPIMADGTEAAPTPPDRCATPPRAPGTGSLRIRVRTPSRQLLSKAAARRCASPSTPGTMQRRNVRLPSIGASGLTTSRSSSDLRRAALATPLGDATRPECKSEGSAFMSPGEVPPCLSPLKNTQGYTATGGGPVAASGAAPQAPLRPGCSGTAAGIARAHPASGSPYEATRGHAPAKRTILHPAKLLGAAEAGETGPILGALFQENFSDAVNELLVHGTPSDAEIPYQGHLGAACGARGLVVCAGPANNLDMLAVASSGSGSNCTSIPEELHFTFTRLATLTGHRGAVHAVAAPGGAADAAPIAPSRCLVASASADRTARLWDALRCTEVASLAMPAAAYSCAFLPSNRRHLAVGSYKLVSVWDAATCRPLVSLADAGMGECRCVCGRPGADQLVTSGDAMQAFVWDMRSATLAQALAGHRSAICAQCFSPDGAHLITGDRAGALRVWDLRTARCVRALRLFAGKVTSLTPAGAFILAGSRAGVVARLPWDEFLLRADEPQQGFAASRPLGRDAAAAAPRFFTQRGQGAVSAVVSLTSAAPAAHAAHVLALTAATDGVVRALYL